MRHAQRTTSRQPADHVSAGGPRALAGLLAANVVSVAGGGISLVALPWFALATTSSTLAAGAVAACETVPLVAWSLLAGRLIERFGADATRIASDVLSAVTVLGIPVLHASVGISFWLLLALVTLNGAARGPAAAASLVLLNALSAEGGASPERAQSTHAASVRLASSLSFPVAGLLIAWRGAPAALVVDAASFAVSAGMLTLTLRGVRPAPTRPAQRRAAPGGGLGVLRADRGLASLSALAIGLAVVEGAWAGVLAPAYGQRVLHSAAELGLLLGAFGIGALAGTLAYPWAAAHADLRRILCSGLGAAVGLRFGVLGLAPGLAVTAAAMLVAGLGAGLLGPLWLGLLGSRVVPALHGRVFGVVLALEQAATAVGALTAGIVLTHADPTAALAGTAVAGVALATAAAALAPLRELRADPMSPRRGTQDGRARRRGDV